MKRAHKIFEAHAITVSPKTNPLFEAIQSELFPIIDSYIEPKFIAESSDSLSWEQISSIFKAAQKLTKDGALDRASRAAGSFGDAVQGKMKEILSKYGSSTPVKDAEAKINRLSQKVIQSVSDADSSLKAAVYRLRMAARKDPSSSNAVLGVLSTVISYAGKGVDAMRTIASKGADAIDEHEFDRIDPTVGDVSSINVNDDSDTMPHFGPQYNKQDRRAKKGDRKQGITKQPNTLSQILGGPRGKR